MKTQQQSSFGIYEAELLARGTLTPIKTSKSGKAFYCLQYSKGGRHVTRYVPSAELELWRKATETYRLFMESVDKFVDMKSAETMEKIRKETEECKKKRRNLKNGRQSSRHGA